MNEEYKIEKGIPIPRKHQGGLTDILSRLEILDSIVAPKDMRAQLSSISKRLGIKCCSRKLDDKTIRIWRIE